MRFDLFLIYIPAYTSVLCESAWDGSVTPVLAQCQMGHSGH